MAWNPTDDPEKRPRYRPHATLARHATIAAAAIVAGGTAYAANQQKSAAAKAAKAAGKPVESKYENKTTQTGWDPVQDDLTFAADEARRLYDQGPVLKGGGKGKGKGKGKGGGGGGKKNAGPSMQDQNRDIAQTIIDTGKAGNPNVAAADEYLGNVLEEGSLGGNEVYQDLNERLKGADLNKGESALMNFLGGKYGGSSGSGGGGGAGSAPKINYNTVQGVNVGVGGVAPAVPYGAAMIPDSTTSPGAFNDWAKGALAGKYLDPNDPDLKAYLDLAQREGQEELDAALQDVGDEFEGVGMYGGSGLALERATTRSKGQQGIADERTRALMGYRGQGLDLMGQAAGLVNSRDIAAGSLASAEREGAAGRASSAASSARAIGAQSELANRGMDLEAIGMLLQNNQFGIGQLGDLGNAVSADRFAAIDSLEAVDDARYGGLDRAYAVSGDQAAKDAAQRARREQQRYENAQAPGRHLDEYLNRLGFFNSAGGTTTSSGTGTNTDPGRGAGLAYSGPSPLAAGLMAGAGTYFQGKAAAPSSSAAPPPTKRKSRATDPTGEPWL